MQVAQGFENIWRGNCRAFETAHERYRGSARTNEDRPWFA